MYNYNNGNILSIISPTTTTNEQTTEGQQQRMQSTNGEGNNWQTNEQQTFLELSSFSSHNNYLGSGNRFNNINDNSNFLELLSEAPSLSSASSENEVAYYFNYSALNNVRNNGDYSSVNANTSFVDLQQTIQSLENERGWLKLLLLHSTAMPSVSVPMTEINNDHSVLNNVSDNSGYSSVNANTSSLDPQQRIQSLENEIKELKLLVSDSIATIHVSVPTPEINNDHSVLNNVGSNSDDASGNANIIPLDLQQTIQSLEIEMQELKSILLDLKAAINFSVPMTEINNDHSALNNVRNNGDYSSVNANTNSLDQQQEIQSLEIERAKLLLLDLKAAINFSVPMTKINNEYYGDTLVNIIPLDLRERIQSTNIGMDWPASFPSTSTATTSIPVSTSTIPTSNVIDTDEMTNANNTTEGRSSEYRIDLPEIERDSQPPINEFEKIMSGRYSG